MNSKIIFAAIVIVGIGVLSYLLYWYSYSQAKDAMSLISVDILTYAQQEVVTVPSRQTHGDILMITAMDILGGFECSKNIQYNDLKTEECQNRRPSAGSFNGPYITEQNMSYAITHENLHFWAEEPDEVFEINVDLSINNNDSKIILPLHGYFFTEYMMETTSPIDNTILNSYVGRGQVQIGGNYWYQVPAVYQTWNNGYTCGIAIGKNFEVVT